MRKILISIMPKRNDTIPNFYDALKNEENKFKIDYFDDAFEKEICDLMSCYDTEKIQQGTIMDDILNTHFTELETLVAIDQLKGSRSARLDGIPAEVFKNLRFLLVPTLTTHFNYCFEKGEYPEVWSEGVIMPIH